MYTNNVLHNVLDRANFLLEKALIDGNEQSVNKYYNIIDKIENQINTKNLSLDLLTYRKKSSRFSRPKTKPNVSRNAASMGYAKPVQQQRVLYKYNCMVTGVKRMDTCAGCGTPKGCLSNSMQYKEQEQ